MYQRKIFGRYLLSTAVIAWLRLTAAPQARVEVGIVESSRTSRKQSKEFARQDEVSFN